MSYKAFGALKNHVEVEFLKSLSYEKINEMMNQLNDKINTLEDKLKRSDNSDYAASPKLPSFKKLNNYMNGWADKGTYKVIKKLGNFA